MMSDAQTKVSALKHNPNVTTDHISKALTDGDWGVRFAAIEHPKATEEHITKALNDEDSDVRIAAKGRLNEQR